MQRKITAVIVLVIVVVSFVGYYEYSNYESQVVSTVVETGTVKGYSLSNGGVGLAQGAAGLLGAGGGAGAGGGVGGQVPAQKSTSTAGAALMTIAVGSNTFTYILPCRTFQYYDGWTLKVAVETLRSGAVAYVPDLACKGAVSPFAALNLPPSTVTITTTSTSKSSSSKAG